LNFPGATWRSTNAGSSQENSRTQDSGAALHLGFQIECIGRLRPCPPSTIETLKPPRNLRVRPVASGRLCLDCPTHALAETFPEILIYRNAFREVFRNSTSCQNCRRVAICSKFNMSHQAKISKPYCTNNVPHDGYAGTARRTGGQAASSIEHTLTTRTPPYRPSYPPSSGQIWPSESGSPVHTLAPPLARNRMATSADSSVSHEELSMHGSHAARLPSSGPNALSALLRLASSGQ
jgi:hypothetical protein